MSDRHEKWVRVEPGTVIPAGQPYRIEYDDDSASEHPNRCGAVSHERDALAEWFVDSSWKPPLVLPTEPTWGIAVHKQRGAELGHWWVCADGWMRRSQTFGKWEPESVIEFVPLTDEQVQRIEAAR